jgi:hypothetical protein
MSGYIPDDAAMSHEPEPWKRERIIRRRTMNRMHARKDELLDLLATPLPDAARQRLTSELADLKHDIAVNRLSRDDRVWYEMRRKWFRR